MADPYLKRILDHNPDTGITEVFRGSSDGESFSIEYVQDAEPAMKANHYENNHTPFDKRADFWHVGTIPMTTIQKWKVEEGIDAFSNDPWHKKRVAAKLNSNEFRAFRARDFKV